MKKYRHFYFAILLLLPLVFSSITTLAQQSATLNFNKHNSVLRSNVINAFAQDNKQNIWIASEKGLYRYREGELYYVAFEEHSLTALHFDKKNNCIWTAVCQSQGTSNLFCIDAETMEIKPISIFFPNTSAAQSSCEVRHIATDAKGNIWIGTARRGVFSGRINPQTKELWVYLPSGLPHSLRQTAIYAMATDREKERMIIASKQDLFIYNVKQTLWQKDRDTKGRVNAVCIDEAGIEWVAFTDENRHYLKIGTENYLFFRKSNIDFRFTELFVIQNKVWASSPTGILHYDGKDWHKMLDKTAFCVFPDYINKQIWVASETEGLFVLPLYIEGEALLLENKSEREEKQHFTYDPNTEVEQDMPYILDVNFRDNDATLLPSSYAALKKLAYFLRLNPDICVELSGHTSQTKIGGDANINLKLSHARAQSVAQYLLTQGVGERQLKIEGYGDAKPLEDLHPNHSKNRRVEFKILSKRLKLH
ncbi:MAG: OmpA family protein [Bernardetiaceae bacterium]|nr:OmpA family protein [Bernardetiaceae bacterium]